MSSAIPFRRLATPQTLLKALAGLILLGLLAGAVMAWPGADDYCYAARATTHGVLATVTGDYLHWGGRFAAVGFMALVGQFPALMQAPGFAVVPLAVILAFLGGTILLLRTVLGTVPPLAALLAGLLGLAVLSSQETLFWLAGAANYGVAFGATLALLAAALAPRLTLPTLAGATALAFVSAGWNEGTALLHTLLLGGLLAVTWHHKTPLNRPRILLLLGMAVLGLLVAFTAPGNFARAGGMPGHSVVKVLFITPLWPLRYAPQALLLVAGWLALCLFFRLRAPRWLAFSPWVTLAATYAILLPGLALRVLMMGNPGPGRVLSQDMFLLWLGMGLLALQLAPGVEAMLKESPARKPLLAGLLAAVVLATTGANVQPLEGRLLGLALYGPAFAHAQQARHTQLAAATGQAVQVLPLPEAATRSVLSHTDLTPNPTNWVNTCTAGYYHAVSVTVNP